MMAGSVALEELYTPDIADAFTARGEAFRQRLQQLADQRSLPVRLSGVGSLMNIHFTQHPVSSPAVVRSVEPRLRQLLQMAMLEAGFYIGKAGYLALMLPLTDADYDRFANAFDEFLDRYSELIVNAV
jgi:glutamate-1-semialdehyde 2,1-aminomutase